MKVKRVCLQCGKEFYTHECYIKRGGGKFCCVGCGTRYRNLHDNPSWKPENRAKISTNHADVSGKNNPAYKDGIGLYRKLMLAKGKPKCLYCGSTENIDVHHIDGNRRNNDIGNLVFLCKKCHIGKAHKNKKLNLDFKRWLENENRSR